MIDPGGIAEANIAETTFYGNYSPVGDILVMAICFVCLILMAIAYISKSRTYTIFRLQMGLLVLAAFASMSFHFLLAKVETVPHVLIMLLYASYHSLLYVDLLLYILYIREQMHLGRDTVIHCVIPSIGITIALCVLEFISIPLHWGFHIHEDNRISSGGNIFYFGYPILCTIIIYMLVRYRKRLYKQVMRGVFGSAIVAFVMLAIQQIFNQTSFTIATFLFPLIAVLYMMHSHPYNLEMGAVDASAFEEMVVDQYSRHRKLLFMSLFFIELDEEGMEYPEEIKNQIRRFAAEFLRGATLFQVTNGRMVLVADLSKNMDYEHTVNRMLNQFYGVFPKYRLPFKILIFQSIDQVSEERDYVNLIQFAENRMEDNTVHFLSEDDIQAFRKRKFVITQLQDICKQGDLDDPRVEVFCQPVLNIETGVYDTAEALMRLNLPDMGRVFPDIFIPIAEEQMLIHQLSLVILHKTCERIREMMAEGYHIVRISINISALELRDERFCSDISRVISDSGIPFEKIAIELTESRSESDFMIMKTKIDELKGNGIKFYLDDFGTGYSNFERIMELPFDIIKFDRSLVLASASDQKSERMVTHLAQMFSDMNYAVLYEGVETQDDETRCKKMDAKYLQGYKYSRPIPIEKLTEYFRKDDSVK